VGGTEGPEGRVPPDARVPAPVEIQQQREQSSTGQHDFDEHIRAHPWQQPAQHLQTDDEAFHLRLLIPWHARDPGLSVPGRIQALEIDSRQVCRFPVPPID
jgi:hypothetical protein